MTANPTIQFFDFHPPLADLKQEVLTGLTEHPKAISPKFFYDEYGSQLFDKITELPEYYPARTEMEILKTYRQEMTAYLGAECLLLELGSGSSQKVRLLLEALRPAIYLPIDISKDFLLHSAQALAQEYPDLEVHAACVDYSAEFQLPHYPEEMPRAAFFPGSSIGNFEPQQAQVLLQRIAQALGTEAHLLIGVDLKKDPERLNAAYNDAQGVTAAFNLNLLTRINRELSADFAVEQFSHQAFYNADHGRVEMHLVSEASQQVHVDGQGFTFQEQETIHTENSYKYSIEQFHTLAAHSGFEAQAVWTDAEQLFSVHCLRVVA